MALAAKGDCLGAASCFWDDMVIVFRFVSTFKALVSQRLSMFRHGKPWYRTLGS